MKEFNHQRAHREWAVPEWQKLPQEVQDLYGEVQRVCDGVNQNKSLCIDWPDGLEAKFDAIDIDVLPYASTVINALGSWDDKTISGFPRDKHGGHWKFQILARQNLVRRGYRDSWPQAPAEQFRDHVEGTDLDDEEKTDLLRKMLQPELTALRIAYVNHRLREGCHSSKPNHQFVIGNKHFGNSESMYLDPRCAPCDFCGLEYDDHISDRVLFIGPNREVFVDENVDLSDAEQKKLETIAPLLEEYAIDGMAFVARKRGR